MMISKIFGQFTPPLSCFLALCFLTSCGPWGSGPYGSASPGLEPDRVYCAEHDCSQFPEGLASIQVAEEWHYFPPIEWLKAHDIPGVATMLSVGSREYGSPAVDNRKWWVDDKFAMPNVSSIFLMPCCEAWEHYFGVRHHLDTVVPQVRIGVALKSQRSPILSKGGDPLPVEALPPEWKPWAEQYHVLRISENPDPISERRRWAFAVQSIDATFLDEPVTVACREGLCQISWIIESGDWFVEFLAVNFVVPDCDNGCDAAEQLTYMFGQFDTFISNFETIWENSKELPTQ